MAESFKDQMRAKMAATGAPNRRTDIHVHDIRGVDEGRAVRVLAVYSDIIGAPSIPVLSAWFSEAMQNPDVSIRADTVQVVPEARIVTFVVEQRPERKPLSASADMTAAGIDQFLDQGGNIWEVRRNEFSEPYLLRHQPTPVEQIVSARRAVLTRAIGRNKTVMLASMSTVPVLGGGQSSLDRGDTVTFYHDGRIHTGVFQDLDRGQAVLKPVGSSRNVSVDPLAILSIVSRGVAHQQEAADLQRSYFQNVWPGNPDMVKQFTPASRKPVKVLPGVEPVGIAFEASFKPKKG